MKKFDEKGTYIRKWIPEFDLGYNEPMVDHAFARDRAIATYKAGIFSIKIQPLNKCFPLDKSPVEAVQPRFWQYLVLGSLLLFE